MPSRPARCAGSHHVVTFVGTHIGKALDLADELAGEGPVRSSEEVDGDLVSARPCPFTQAPHAVRQHAAGLAGRGVVDITNPVDLSVLEPLDVFIAGDDADAKAMVAALAEDGGLRPVDAGALARARELEALGYLHMAVQPALGTAFGSAVAVLP